jgi:hypothetical protein
MGLLWLGFPEHSLGASDRFDSQGRLILYGFGNTACRFSGNSTIDPTILSILPYHPAPSYS